MTSTTIRCALLLFVAVSANFTYEVTTFIGQPGQTGYQDGSYAILGPWAWGIAFDSNGNLFFGDGTNNVIRRATPNAVVTTVCGNDSDSSLEEGCGSNAQFYDPYDLKLIGGVFYMTQHGSYAIHQITMTTYCMTVWAGSVKQDGHADGIGLNALFDVAWAMIANENETVLYVSEQIGQYVRQVEIATVNVTTLAGNGTCASANGYGPDARFCNPQEMYFKFDLLYLSDHGNNRIVTIDPVTTFVSPFACTGELGNDDGPALTLATCNGPCGLIMMEDRTLYFVSYSGCSLRRLAEGYITTVAGIGGECGFADGIGSAVRFGSMEGFAQSPLSGDLFIADIGNVVIRRVHISNGTSTSGTNKLEGAIIGAAACFVVVTTAAAAILWKRRQQKNISASSSLSLGIAVTYGSMNSSVAPQSPTSPPWKRYSVSRTKPLGAGSYGTVFKALDVESGGYVAVKETTLEGASEAARKGIEHEFSMLVKLDHPNILKVLCLHVTEDNIAQIFMEWLPSGSVSDVIRSSGFRLHEAVVRRYTCNALSGLKYLGSKGLLHRDIKPSNMLLTVDGLIKISDFGTSQVANAVAADVKVRITGTPAYLAPECAAGNYSHASDIWAIACSVVEMATGVLPWNHLVDAQKQSLQLIAYISSAVPPNHHPLIPSTLSLELQQILIRCFAKNPIGRPTADELLSHPYFDVTRPLPVDSEFFDDYLRMRDGIRNTSSRLPLEFTCATRTTTVTNSIGVTNSKSTSGSVQVPSLTENQPNEQQQLLIRDETQ